jgi:type IV pilus assembly protein PilA
MNKLKNLAGRRGDDEQGFTLIELMVVVLIIAILIAIAIPTFLGARQRAQDRAAQSDIRNGLTAEKTVYTDTQAYDTTVATLKGVESSLDWGGKLTMTISADKQSICLTETSKSGTVFAIADVAAGANAGTYFAKVTCPALTNGATPGAGFATGGW